MIKFKKEKIENLPLKKHYLFSLIFNSIIIAIGLLANFILPPQIPLFYGLPSSEQQLTPSLYIILPSIIAFVITLLNAYLSLSVDNIYLRKILAYSTIAVSFLAAITTLKIIFLVGNL